MNNDPMLARRSFIKAVSGTALLGGGVVSLSSCSDRAPQNDPAANQDVILPSYIPYEGVDPDLPATEQGVQAGYFTYPADRVASVDGVPGAGGPMSALVNIFLPVPPGKEQNAYWQGLNERLGVDLSVNMIPDADFAAKFATTIAGNDIPDFVEIKGRQPQLPQLLAAKFADLTEFLAGDAVKDYPNLANIPTRCWETAVYSGGIYGIPIPRERAGLVLFYRKDLFEQLGLSADLNDGAEFIDLCREITASADNRWAIGSAGGAVTYLQYMLKAPNEWREENGKLTSFFEVDETRLAIETVASMWQEGLIHPDAFADAPAAKQWFGSGEVMLALDNYNAWTGYIKNNSFNPDLALDLMVPPGFEGGTGSIWYGVPSYSLTALKKGDEARVQEMLRVANWLAAPFGTEEYFYRVYGEEGVHNTVVDGNPRYTDLGNVETTVPVRYIAEAPAPLYEPGRPDDVRTQHTYQETVIPDGAANPTAGLFSDTDASKGGTLTRTLNDLRAEVMQGRKTLADWDAGVEAWRTNGGDQIRAEYEEQLQQKGEAAGRWGAGWA